MISIISQKRNKTVRTNQVKRGFVLHVQCRIGGHNILKINNMRVLQLPENLELTQRCDRKSFLFVVHANLPYEQATTHEHTAIKLHGPKESIERVTKQMQ
jgi:hypothetical protein